MVNAFVTVIFSYTRLMLQLWVDIEMKKRYLVRNIHFFNNKALKTEENLTRRGA